MHEISFKLPHINLSALEFGDASKPLVVALHGWLDNAASFIPLAPFLTDYHLIALDMAGHGLSQHRSPDANYHLVDWVQDLHQLLELNQWSEVILLGHSLGGIVASMYASCFPERVSKLVVMESFGPLSKEVESSPQQLRDSIVSRLEVDSKPARHPATLRQAVQARKVAGDVSTEAARLLVSRNLDDSSGELRWRTDRRLRTISSMRVTEDQAKAFMHAIKAPMLVILGQNGFEKLKVNFQHRQQWVTNLTSCTCPGGHHLHMEHPFAVGEKIVQFINC
ncbi:alpha/beta fold hydrolase [Neptunicella sp. SCSIO 80796]|uniref:alpha/beta fold hydrolase n=1 Tax=Neptunicella plasticusilytica TaxID=3117012 RepID=UPI003A4DE5DD